MLRYLLLITAGVLGFISSANATCSGAGGWPFNCTAGTTPGATDYFLGGNTTGVDAGLTVKYTGLQVAQGMLGLVSQFSGGGTTNFLRADGSWAVPPSGSGSTSPGGSSGQVQFNSGGSFAGLTNAQLTADINLFSSTLPGAVPASGGGTTSFLRADGTWATPAGTGGGTVNSVGLALPSIFTVTGSPVTGSGTLTGTLVSETANTVFAAPNGSTGAPAFRALVGADLPLATTSSFGTVKPDGSTITISNGVISAPGGGGSVTWPAFGDLVLSNGTSTPGGLAPVNGDCVVGSSGAWTAGACPGGGGAATVPVSTITASGTAQSVAFPVSGSAAYDITQTANCVLTLSGGTVGQYQTVTLILRQNSTAGWTATLPTGVKWPGGTAPTPNTVAGQIDVFHLSTSDGGVTVFGSY